jgi:hypothetical protein
MPAYAPWHLNRFPENPYFAFTDRCNADEMRIILASGQACVWHSLTLASKDGDWIVQEEEAHLSVVRRELSALGARYRLGAPLDARWLAAGWSSHFEALSDAGLRLRFDFVSRPPRVPVQDLAALWDQTDRPAVVPRRELILLKQTMRLKDYAFVGSLALEMPDPESQVRFSLDAEHLHEVLVENPGLAQKLPTLRPGFPSWPATVEALGEAMDQEVRRLRKRDEARMKAYQRAMIPWAERFRTLDLRQLPLAEAHELLTAEAEGVLPQTSPVEEES